MDTPYNSTANTGFRLRRMTTLTVVTACWGEDYAGFIPKWFEGYNRLNRKPDELILGIGKGDPTGLSGYAPDEAKVVEVPEGQLSVKWDYLIRQATCEWFSYMPIDDEPLPGAYDEIDLTDGFDVYVDSIVAKHGGYTSKGEWQPEALIRGLIAPGFVPMRLDLYKQIGLKHDYKWFDWILQVDMVKLGAKPFMANTTRMIWDEGIDRKTYSSKRNDYYDAEYEKAAEYARANGF